MLVTWYTVLPMVSHYFTNLQVVAICQEMQHGASKGREEEDCTLVNVDLSNAEKKEKKRKSIQHVC